ncbi:MAG: glycerophosphodiester phosphodiesterase [Flammeovirgaceae bacterium]|nr:glycerophosphodiester phosphodiesterase [Flammeovirgaceae bacterium]
MRTSCFPFQYFLLFFFLNFYSGKAQTFEFDLQGHRGARGLMPENTIPAFIKALEIGVNTLEMDVVISKDNQVVVSHEPWFNHSICTDSLNNQISEKAEKKHKIYEIDYAQIQLFDCGSTLNLKFPDQQSQKASKPLLEDVIISVEKYIKENDLPPVNYNIEIKSSPKGDGNFHPEIPEFSQLLHNVVKKHLPAERVIIQCFDFRVLKYWHREYPEYKLAALVSKVSIEKQLKELGFTPTIYSPSYKYMDEDKIKKLHKIGMIVIPWTVNEKSKMIQLLDWGVDGIITDYPNIGKELKN